jgi:hypothetical protein
LGAKCGMHGGWVKMSESAGALQVSDSLGEHDAYL